MNNILKLKGNFQNKDYDGNYGNRNIAKNGFVTSDSLNERIKELEALQKFWATQN